MILKKLVVSNFRNYKQAEFLFGGGVNLIFGENATGKTNLLEAVGLLSVGKSFRARVIEDMISFGEEVGFARGFLGSGESDGLELEVLLSTGSVMGKRVQKRKFIVDGAAKRRDDFLGYLPSVVFLPEEMDVLVGGAELRREMLDVELCQVASEYRSSLTTYGQALKRRNKVLEAIREGVSTRYALAFWDGLLIKHGSVLVEYREEFIDYVNKLWAKSELFNRLSLVYDKSLISEDRLEQYKKEEVLVGHTLVGPHKDDVMVYVDGKRSLGEFGSRGEQRMAVLAIKVAEMYFLKEKKEMEPLLILDDIFSELDVKHKNEVLRVMKGRQVLVTTALSEDVEILTREFGENGVRILNTNESNGV